MIIIIKLRRMLMTGFSDAGNDINTEANNDKLKEKNLDVMRMKRRKQLQRRWR